MAHGKQVTSDHLYVVDSKQNLPAQERGDQESLGDADFQMESKKVENTHSSEKQLSNQACLSENPSSTKAYLEMHSTSDGGTDIDKPTEELKYCELSNDNEASKELEPNHKFYKKLDDIKIHWPGGSQVKFNDNDSLKSFLKSQYRDWEMRDVTSIPCARVPKIFIRNVDLSKELPKHFKSLQKGDEGENKVYRMFVNEIGRDHIGIIVLPNFNGSLIFEKGELGEIDMIVAHPLKGIFLFEVKNESGKKKQKEKWIKNLKSDMLKHVKFIRHLLNYNKNHPDQPTTSSSAAEKEVFEMDTVPIHAVFYYIPDDLNSIAKLADNDPKWYTEGNVIVFQKSDFRNFASKWGGELEKIPSMKSSATFDILLARLVALNSLEVASALIRQKIVSNQMQSIQTDNLHARVTQQLSETLTQEEDKEYKN